MTNAEKFQEIFKKFATEVWAFPEKDFLEWLNAEYKEPITQERQAESDKFDAAFQDGYNNGYAQARFDYYEDIGFCPYCGAYIRRKEMTKEEAKEFLINISYDLGTLGIEDYTLKDGKKIRDAIKALENKALDKEPCEDCISRQAVIDEMEKRHAEGDCITKGFIKNLPSVTPIRPKGHWIGNYQVDFGEWQEYDVKLSDGYVTDNCHCSECDEELLSGDRGMFCPNCGCRMESSNNVNE